jgi:alkylhydroperoxidase family enzyme
MNNVHLFMFLSTQLKFISIMEKNIKLFQDAEKAGMFVVGQRNPAVFNAFLNVAHEVMHPDSAFSQLHRELLGAYVSKQFGCSFCHLGHLETAFAFGGDEVRMLVDNPSDELKPIYALSDKVIANAVKEEDIENFIALGYTEKHYEDIVLVCALFGFANRMVTGFGIEYNAQRDETSSRYLAKGYKMP